MAPFGCAGIGHAACIASVPVSVDGVYCDDGDGLGAWAERGNGTLHVGAYVVSKCSKRTGRFLRHAPYFLAFCLVLLLGFSRVFFFFLSYPVHSQGVHIIAISRWHRWWRRPTIPACAVPLHALGRSGRRERALMRLVPGRLPVVVGPRLAEVIRCLPAVFRIRGAVGLSWLHGRQRDRLALAMP